MEIHMSRQKPRWIRRWNSVIAPTPVLPGVWKRKEGGYLVRGRAVDPRTGKQREVRRNWINVSAYTALEKLQKELSQIRAGEDGKKTEQVRFCTYAVSLLDRKIKTNEIKSAKTKELWGNVLEDHLFPEFGDFFVDKIRRLDIEQWRKMVGDKIQKGVYSPHTANSWFSMLRTILNAAVAEYELPRNPIAGVKQFDTSLHPPFTEEEPNSLTVEEVPRFLWMMRQCYPQHFAMVALGFALGLRPSSLRPLRRKGPKSDVDWYKGILRIRRSYTVGTEVMETTKTGKKQGIPLPQVLLDILQGHVSLLPEGPMRESDLLFPTKTGGFRSNNVLNKPFNEVAKKIGLGKHISPKGMRRTFQDLARAASVDSFVTRAISGHETETMQTHYSTAQPAEMEQGIAKVTDIAGYQQALEEREPPSGMHGGMHGPQRKKAG